MAHPVIGLTAANRSVPETAEEKAHTVIGCLTDYCHCVERSGGSPLLLPPNADASVIEAAVERMDALLLTGGGDICPSEYNEEPHPATERQDKTRDAMERTAARIARERGMPILAICRGIQVLNIEFGGSLIQDIPYQVEGALRHTAKKDEEPAYHSIKVCADSLLARVLGATETMVNSTHHQSAGRIGEGLRVCARASDGVVEGLEGEDGSPILAVQWHPERMYDDSAPNRRLFDWLVAESVKWRQSCAG